MKKVNDMMRECSNMREDYFECLHGNKERARVAAVLEEQKRQENEAKHGAAQH